MGCPCETRTSTCRSFATISSGLYRFLAIAVLLDVKDIPQVGPLQGGWIMGVSGHRSASLRRKLKRSSAADATSREGHRLPRSGREGQHRRRGRGLPAALWFPKSPYLDGSTPPTDPLRIIPPESPPMCHTYRAHRVQHCTARSSGPNWCRLDKRQLSPAAMLPRLTLRRNAGGSLTCPPRVQQFDSKEMTMTPTEWLILSITTFVVVIVLGVWFYRINSD